LRGRVPIDHAPAAVDEAFVVKIDKNFLDRANVSVVKGIAFARPIAGTTESLELLDNDAAVFVLPFQPAPQKFFPTQSVSRFVFGASYMFFDRGRCADSVVIGAGQ